MHSGNWDISRSYNASRTTWFHDTTAPSLRSIDDPLEISPTMFSSSFSALSSRLSGRYSIVPVNDLILSRLSLGSHISPFCYQIMVSLKIKPLCSKMGMFSKYEKKENKVKYWVERSDLASRISLHFLVVSVVI